MNSDGQPIYIIEDGIPLPQRKPKYDMDPLITDEVLKILRDNPGAQLKPIVRGLVGKYYNPKDVAGTSDDIDEESHIRRICDRVNYQRRWANKKNDK